MGKKVNVFTPVTQKRGQIGITETSSFSILLCLSAFQACEASISRPIGHFTNPPRRIYFIACSLSENTLFYSVRSATTGSFFAALREGIMPAKSVRSTLMPTRIAAAPMGRCAFKVAISVSLCRMMLMGMQRR